MRPLKFSPRTRAFLRVLLSHYITNGITACLGLLVISLIVENWLGAYAASLATVGVIAVTPPDVAAPRRGKLRTMMLPFITGVPVFYIVQLLNGRHLELGIFLTFFSFLAFLAMAWGKRGIPVAMGMMFTAIFSIASPGPKVRPFRARSISVSAPVSTSSGPRWPTWRSTPATARWPWLTC